jgi:hypothetical protein
MFSCILVYILLFWYAVPRKIWQSRTQHVRLNREGKIGTPTADKKAADVSGMKMAAKQQSSSFFCHGNLKNHVKVGCTCA